MHSMVQIFAQVHNLPVDKPFDDCSKPLSSFTALLHPLCLHSCTVPAMSLWLQMNRLRGLRVDYGQAFGTELTQQEG